MIYPRSLFLFIHFDKTFFYSFNFLLVFYNNIMDIGGFDNISMEGQFQ